MHCDHAPPPPTLIVRHQKENLRKCSLRGLEGRPDLLFLAFPEEGSHYQTLMAAESYLLLTIDAPPLSHEDRGRGLLLLDGTWRYARQMARALPPPSCQRSIPAAFQTAYPRRHGTFCSDPARGLASIEALFIAYFLLGRSVEGLLDHYYWKALFLERNAPLLDPKERASSSLYEE